jgi:hypothetical protein
MMTDAHEEKETLSVDVDIPTHDPRKTTALFIKTKRMIMKIGSLLGFTIRRPAGRCWICGKTEAELGAPLEAHHFGIERCYISAQLRWDLIQEDFPIFDWKHFNPAKPETFVDNMSSQGILLCKQHHTGKDTGIHMLPWNLWLMQRYLCDGTAFNPKEIIHHDKDVL